MSIMEALYIVSQNKHGVAMNYWDCYLPAVLMVNEAFPVTGYTTTEDDAAYWQAVDQRAYNREQDAVYDGRMQR